MFQKRVNKMVYEPYADEAYYRDVFEGSVLPEDKITGSQAGVFLL